MQTDGIELGDVVRDKITGFQGVAIARTLWLSTCDRITIQPQVLHDGKPIDSFTFDVFQVEVIRKAGQPAHNTTGGPRPEPQRR